ncbi:MAG: DNA-3-methyladenine glycosylase 2 family protein [Chloroflexi bacterium]|nr:DNA-3-methyladenine glycosylase 2 family protein [Chloroflexota bacterium]
MIRLDEQTLLTGVDVLAGRDRDLRRIWEQYGAPPLWARPVGFPTLVHIILEQQVSLASARAAFERLKQAVSPLTPAGLLGLRDAELKTIGFSHQKAAYARHLAQEILAGRLDLSALEEMDDDRARLELLRLRGIGPWSADIYLLMALLRPDVWPVGDLALAVAAQKVKWLATLPSPAELEDLGRAWQPWRAVAARLLWHYYLSV